MNLSNLEQKATRSGFGEAIIELADINQSIVALTADLKESLKLTQFAKQFPDRFIEVGVAEQNMASIAAGLALSGKIPFMTSFATFSPGRNLDQIRASICYTNANVKIVSSHTGLSNGGDGATHQALEDIAIMRTLPNTTVLVPCDFIQAKQATHAAAEIKGPVYIRLTRNDSPILTSETTEFKIGKAQILQEGTDFTLVAAGPVIYEALQAAHELEVKHKISGEVINMHTIKPFDTATLVKSAKKTKFVVTVEEHQIAGGLGGVVAETLSELYPTRVLRLGMNDSFGESGTYEDLLDKYQLTREHIVKKILSFAKLTVGGESEKQ